MAEDKTTLVIACRATGTAEIDQFGKSVRSADLSAKDLLKSLAALVAGSQIAQFGKQAVSAFSDLEETTSKFNVVFAGVNDQAAEFTKELQKNYGQSVLSSRLLLSSTGDLLTGFGFMRQQALELSMQVATLGSDLASFSNYAGGAEGAAYALTKAMLGETEQAKMLGIAIKTDTPEYRAMIKNIMDAEGVTVIQAKALAALRIAYSQSGNAIGDFARTQDSIANQARILNNEWVQAQAHIGRGLAPSYRTLQGAGLDLLRSFNELSPEAQDFATKTAALTTAMVGAKTAFTVMAAAQEMLNASRVRGTAATTQETAAVTRNTAALLSEAGASKLALQSAIARNAGSINKQKSSIGGLSAQLQEAFAGGASGKELDKMRRKYEEAQKGLQKLFDDRSVLVGQAKSAAGFDRINKSAGRFGVTLATTNKLLEGTAQQNALLGKTSSVAWGAVTRGATIAGGAIKGVGVALLAVGKMVLPLLAVSAAIVGVEHLLTRGSREAQGRVDVANRELETQRALIATNSKKREEDVKSLERLKQLSTFVDLSNSEQEEAVRLANELNSSYSGLGISFDSITGKIIIATDAFAKLNEESKKAAELELTKEAEYAKKIKEAEMGGLLANLRSPEDFFKTLGSVLTFGAIEDTIGAMGEYSVALQKADLEKQIESLLGLYGELNKAGETGKANAIKVVLDAAIAERDAIERLRNFQKGIGQKELKTISDLSDITRNLKSEYYDQAWKLDFDISDPQEQLKKLDERLEKEKKVLESIEKLRKNPLETKINQEKYQQQEIEKQKEILGLEYQRMSVELQMNEENLRSLERQREEQQKMLDIAGRYRQTAQDAISAGSTEAIRLQSRTILSGGNSALQKSMADNIKSVENLTKKMTDGQAKMISTLQDILREFEKIKFGIV